MERPVAAISGAAAGIGRALAVQLSAAGYRLVLLDRDAEGLADVRRSLEDGVEVLSLVVDFANSASIADAAAHLLATIPRIDVLVNNAGIALHGRVDECDVLSLESVISTNLLGPIRFTAQVLPLVKAAPRGVVVNMSSVFGLVAPAGQAAYSASKFGLRGFSEALGNELARDGVLVLTVYPAAAKTRIARNALSALRMPDEVREQHEERFYRNARLAPDDIARRIVEAIRGSRTRLVIGRDARLADVIQRLMPGAYGRFARLVSEVLKRLSPGPR
ncbi:SDR family NAD(P)-dependent oxidoreductase [Phreatobacter sp.]|uniref:SDR family NAD(P)-dependent oxidoreductase n=1 Tax=Phreatobacter sp. TaxID=1966341 RepID=UPI003F7081DC